MPRTNGQNRIPPFLGVLPPQWLYDTLRRRPPHETASETLLPEIVSEQMQNYVQRIGRKRKNRTGNGMLLTGEVAPGSLMDNKSLLG